MKRQKRIKLKELKRKLDIHKIGYPKYISENCYYQFIDRSKWH